jgi:hypothetical protein
MKTVQLQQNFKGNRPGTIIEVTDEEFDTLLSYLLIPETRPTKKTATKKEVNSND